MQVEKRKAGRPCQDQISVYPNFLEVYSSWKSGRMRSKDAISALGVSRRTFYDLIKKHEDANLLGEE
jgi:hypothetical protein